MAGQTKHRKTDGRGWNALGWNALGRQSAARRLTVGSSDPLDGATLEEEAAAVVVLAAGMPRRHEGTPSEGPRTRGC